jgi:hypothetical protein
VTVTHAVAMMNSRNFADGFATKYDLIELAIDRAANSFDLGFRLRPYATLHAFLSDGHELGRT